MKVHVYNYHLRKKIFSWKAAFSKFVSTVVPPPPPTFPASIPINQSTRQTHTQSAIQSVSQPASHRVKQSVRQPDTQSVSQSSVWAGWRLLDGPFVWAEKPQTQQRPAPAPHNGSPHKSPHTGTMGRAQSGGGRLSWGYPPAHFSPHPPTHTHTVPPPIPLLKRCCRCLPVSVAPGGSKEMLCGESINLGFTAEDGPRQKPRHVRGKLLQVKERVATMV